MRLQADWDLHQALQREKRKRRKIGGDGQTITTAVTLHARGRSRINHTATAAAIASLNSRSNAKQPAIARTPRQLTRCLPHGGRLGYAQGQF